MDSPGPDISKNRIRARTILVADDNSALRRLVVEVLGQQHHTVIAAADGAEALALANRCKTGIDLLVTDLDMPKLNGVQLAAEIRELFPSVRVILMSGSHSGWAKEAAFLKKRFTTLALLEKVTALLDPS
jgi:CheY-like chemotaxis protein